MFSPQRKNQFHHMNRASQPAAYCEGSFNPESNNPLQLNFTGQNQYNLTDNSIHRAIRRAQRSNPFIGLNDLLKHPEILLLLEVVEKNDIENAYCCPARVLNEYIATEYITRTHWTLHEASFLTIGLDPFYAAIDPAYYASSLLEKVAKAEEQIRCAIKSRLLNASIQGGELAVEVAPYCKWVLINGMAHTVILRYLGRVLGAQTLLTSGGRAGPTSSPPSCRI